LWEVIAALACITRRARVYVPAGVAGRNSCKECGG